ncbi:MAG: TonB-dependent receptor [Novosphingobium sp.]
MKIMLKSAFAGVSLLALSAPLHAQEITPDAAEDTASDAGDIIVTARRRDESAQDVPLVVNAVTADTIAKLNFREFRDIAATVPGLSLNSSANGIGSQATLRGVNFDVNASGNNGTIEFYLNDAPVSSNIVFQTMFDVAQIEVLRGPQGTLRGRASPSGSITLTTRRPDLSEIGGYINMTGTTQNAINVNAAFGMPIIQDVLALRVAGVYEQNDGNDVRRLGGGLNPYVKSKGIRASLRFDPTDFITIDANYARLVRDARQWDQVESANLADGTLPASPTLIRASDRLAVAQIPRTFHQEFDVWNWRAEVRFAGQKLNYVGSYNKAWYSTVDPNDKGNFFGSTILPVFNGLPAFPPFNGTGTLAPQAVPAYGLLSQNTTTAAPQETHEVRFSSDERLFGLIDYVVGGMINKTSSDVVLRAATPLINVPITFDNGATYVGFLPTLVNNSLVLRGGSTLERSLFGNVTVHIGDKTEISGGARYINFRDSSSLVIDGVNIPSPTTTENNWIYSASVKHRFNDSLMAYFSFGTSWRPGSTTNGIVDRNNAQKSPRTLQYLFPPSEKSKSYEIGIKSDWLDRRLRLNVTAYLQDFDNYIYSAPNIYAIATDTLGNSTVNLLSPGLAVGVPAQVKGVEAELSWNTPHFSAGASVNYAISKIKNGVIPCNPYVDAQGNPRVPTLADIQAAAPGEQFAVCNVDFRAGTLPPFSATLHAEYNTALSGKVDGYIRGLASIYGDSQNDPSNKYDDVPAYALFNFYAGIRDPDGAWDVGLFAKNLFNVQRTLTRNATAFSSSYYSPATAGQAAITEPSAYRLITTNQPREFGLNVRYSFGSR